MRRGPVLRREQLRVFLRLPQLPREPLLWVQLGPMLGQGVFLRQQAIFFQRVVQLHILAELRRNSAIPKSLIRHRLLFQSSHPEQF